MNFRIFTLLVALCYQPFTWSQEMAPVEFVFETYNFCLYEIDADTEDYNGELLTCVNDELEYVQYATFDSLNELREYISGYLGQNDNAGVSL